MSISLGKCPKRNGKNTKVLTAPIKVNIISPAGKRTSTTLSYSICKFYFDNVLNAKPDAMEYRKRLEQAIQEFVMMNKFEWKEELEQRLLFEIYKAGSKKGLNDSIMMDI